MQTKSGKEVIIDSVLVEAGQNNDEGTQVIAFDWNSNIGWGQMTLYRNPGEGESWKADTETMCSPDGKEFLKALFDKFIEQVEVVG